MPRARRPFRRRVSGHGRPATSSASAGAGPAVIRRRRLRRSSPVAAAGQGEVEGDVDAGDDDRRGDGVGVEVLQDRDRGRQVVVGDDRPQRGVLEQDDELAHDGGHHRGDRLGYQDEPHELAPAQADRVARLGLALRDRVDPRPHDLGEYRTVVHGQPEDHRLQRGRVPGEVGQGAGRVRGEEDQQQQRDRAEELDDRPGRAPDPPVTGEPGQPEGDPERQREDRRDRGRLQGSHQAREYLDRPDVTLEEGLPFLRRPLALLAERPHDPGGSGGEGDREHHGEQAVAAPAAGPGRVVQDRRLVHRATAHRLASQPKNKPTGRVSTTKNRA